MPRYQRPGQEAIAQQKINRALVDGVGGMQFTAQAPPGVGRLIRIPFYAETGVAPWNALTGQLSNTITNASATISTVYPVVHYINDAAAGFDGASPTLIMRTPQISWALIRVVGFEAHVAGARSANVIQPEICFRDLKIGGGATLFVHEDWASAGIYLAGQDSFAGLRDYPLLKSPNVAEVSVQAVADTVGNTVETRTNFSCNLVSEILQDDNYGQHVPGPYARQGALVRQGGTFVQG